MKRPFPRRSLLVNGTLGVLLAGGAGLAYITLADGGDGAAAATRVSRVARGTVVSSVSASGSVASRRSRSLSFGASGTVAKIYVKAGEKVSEGESLARLDQTEALEELTAAKANLAVAAKKDTSTEQGYAEYVKVRNSYNSAVRKLDGTVLKAPFSATVTTVNGTVGGSSSGTSSSGSSGSSGASGSGGSAAGAGSSASSSSSSSSSGTGFIELADTSRLQVEGQFTEADTTKLKVGQAGSATFDALTGKTAAGKIIGIAATSTTSDNVVKFAAQFGLTDVPAGVRIGQTATVEITVAEVTDVLYVPSAAVRTAGGQSTVTVVRSGEREQVQVEVGVKGDQGTEIRSGLEEGDQIALATTATGSNSGARTGGGMPGGGMPGGGGGGGMPGGGGGRR